MQTDFIDGETVVADIDAVLTQEISSDSRAHPTDALLHIQYSIGASEPQHLAYIYEIDTGMMVALPREIATNIETTSITISSLNIESSQEILLDAMWIGEQENEQPRIEKPTENTARVLDKVVEIDNTAEQTCLVEEFSVDLRERSITTNTILLEAENGASGVLEIGSFPDGLDIYFSKSKKYTQNIDGTVTNYGLSIVKKEWKKDGDITIPIFYTQNNLSSVCQLNITY